MSSRREQILAAVSALLASIPCERSRVVAFSRADGLSAWIEPLQDSASQVVHNRIDWQLLARVGIIARGRVPDQVADPAVVALHSALMADLTLGGLTYDIQPRNVSWQLLDEDNAVAVVACDFLILYRTTLQDIEVES